LGRSTAGQPVLARQVASLPSRYPSNGQPPLL